MLDTKALAEVTAVIVKAHVDAALLPLLRRIDELEKREPMRGEPGQAGRDGVDGKNGADGKDGAAGRDGKDAEPVADEQIAAVVAAYLAANPPAAGKDGRDGIDGRDGKDGVSGRDGADGKDGAPGVKGTDGRDGISLAGAMIDREGNLIVTMSNGEHRQLGAVVGRDGRDGKDGSAGAAGMDGRDGVGFEDVTMIEDERGVVLRFIRGEVVKDFALPVVIDRGVYREGTFYLKGSGVTWGGSFWIAQEDTTDKPEISKAWRLAVKRGRDGKDAK